jgi:hypothetical protein
MPLTAPFFSSGDTVRGLLFGSSGESGLDEVGETELLPVW